MRPKRIVLALGGNTLGRTLPEQRAAARDLARSLGELLQGESQLVVVHGTGPQVFWKYPLKKRFLGENSIVSLFSKSK